jgi:hypothetical protein
MFYMMGGAQGETLVTVPGQDPQDISHPAKRNSRPESDCVPSGSLRREFAGPPRTTEEMRQLAIHR